MSETTPKTINISVEAPTKVLTTKEIQNMQQIKIGDLGWFKSGDGDTYLCRVKGFHDHDFLFVEYTHNEAGFVPDALIMRTAFTPEREPVEEIATLPASCNAEFLKSETTPRTDAASWREGGFDHPNNRELVDADFARALERELAESRAEVARMREALVKLDAMYRAELDNVPTRPKWLAEVLANEEGGA